MAFPVVEATNNSAEGVNTASHTVNLPANIQAGETLFCFFSSDFTTVTFPVGWTKIYGEASYLSVGWRKADGLEGPTMLVTTDASKQSVHITYRISGAPDPTITPPEASVGASQDNSTPNPDSLTVSGGSDEYLWIAVAGSDDGTDLYTSYPVDYGNGESYQSAESSVGCNVAVARRELEAETENPGNFVIENNERWYAVTIAVYPEEIPPAGLENKSANMGAKMIAGKLI